MDRGAATGAIELSPFLPDLTAILPLPLFPCETRQDTANLSRSQFLLALRIMSNLSQFAMCGLSKRAMSSHRCRVRSRSLNGGISWPGILNRRANML